MGWRTHEEEACPRDPVGPGSADGAQPQWSGSVLFDQVHVTPPASWDRRSVEWTEFSRPWPLGEEMSERQTDTWGWAEGIVWVASPTSRWRMQL